MAYISNKEIKAIIKENNRQIKALQKRNKSYTKDDYITKMKDENNVVEFENLHTYFYTDNGVFSKGELDFGTELLLKTFKLDMYSFNISTLLFSLFIIFLLH